MLLSFFFKELGIEKRVFVISRAAAEDCEFFKHNLESPEIRIPEEARIRDYVLEKVIEFLEYRASHPEQKELMNKEALDRSRTDNLTEYDRNFIESLDTPTHLRVLLAANFLNIPPLLVIAQKHLANLIKSRQPEEIKTFFKIPDELQDDDRNP